MDPAEDPRQLSDDEPDLDAEVDASLAAHQVLIEGGPHDLGLRPARAHGLAKEEVVLLRGDREVSSVVRAWVTKHSHKVYTAQAQPSVPTL